MSRVRPAAALAAITALTAAVLVAASPATAATETVYSLNFDEASISPWTQSGGGDGTLSYVDVEGNQALAVARTADYVGIQTPTGDFVPGTTYTFSAKVRLAAGTTGTTSLRFVGKPGYSWIGNTSGVSADAWTTITGTWTVPTMSGEDPVDPATTQAYVGSGALVGSDAVDPEVYTYLIDDIAITTEAPEECIPEALSLSSLDFTDSTTGDWTQSGGGDGTLSYVDVEGNQALAVARTADYVGIQTPTGDFVPGTTYTFSAKVRLAAGTTGTTSLRFVGKPGYSWIGNTSGVSADAWTTITGTWTVPTMSGEDPVDPATTQAYVGSGALVGSDAVDPEVYTYLIDDIAITYMSVCSDGPEPGTVLIDTDFEEDLDGWTKRDDGDFTLARTDEDSHGGDYSAKISDRVSQGNGIGYDVTELLEAGATYELTAWVRLENTASDEMWLSMRVDNDGQDPTFNTLQQIEGLAGGGWHQVVATFTAPAADGLYLYFETPWISSSEPGDTSAYFIDDITLVVPEPPVVQDLTPIKDTVDFPMGVAIDQRETLGASSELLLKHFNQITPENFMKPEAWYNAEGEWAPNAGQIDPLMDFAQENDLNLYGHVLVWHSQTPAWFFQDEAGNPLTTSEADKQILRDRMRDHINNVADYLAQWGEFGGDNPLTAFDVVNEVIDDSAAYADGLRRSEWYRILGEEYIHLAFEYAEEAFNAGEHTTDGADRPVALFINDYNTEQSGKRSRYLALVDRLVAAEAPIDGIGHQFHLNLSTPVSSLDDALDDAATRGLLQAVTELDVTTGTPESAAKFIDQGYYYRDAFEIFRDHAEQMYSVTVWGLIDSRSWRDSSGGPLVFDDGFQAKPAYYGIVEPSGLEDPLVPRLRTANSFAGDVAATAEGVASGQWDLLPLHSAGDSSSFQTRWAADHLTVFVTVSDATDDDSDAVTVELGEDTYVVTRDGVSSVPSAVVESDGGYDVVLHAPLTDAAQGDTIDLDVRVTDGGDTSGWNSPGVLGTVTLVEALSHVEIPEAAVDPAIDGDKDLVWSTASAVQSAKFTQGSTGAVGTFNLLWDDNMLYVFAEVPDPTVDVSGSDPWVQDSVEIYVDRGNFKNGSYRYDDTQIRINADNVVSFGTGDEAFQASKVTSAAKRVDGGYVIEAAIDLIEYGGLGSIQGLDVQVNDASGGVRTSITNWADPTGAGYQSTARWGVASLVEGTAIVQPPFTPTVSGSTVVGKTLSVKNLPTGTQLSYRWLREGASISGATGATYKLTTSDIGKRISVRVTSVAPGAENLTVTSAKTAKVLGTFTKVSSPKISGTARVGYKLTAKVSSWSPQASYKFQWYSDGKAIKNATGSTFRPTRWQAGTKITVKVTGSRTNYVSVTKESTGVRVPLLTLRVNRSQLNGPTRVGGTLVVRPGASHPVATVKSYQWYANGKAIKGATKSSYKITSAQLGKRIWVRVAYKATGYATKYVWKGPTYVITRAR